MSVIYRITNMANDHYYIGSAESFERRKWQHIYALKRGEHKNPRLQAAWNKYGPDMFVFEVLEEVPANRTAFDIENTYLLRCVGQPDCYNINTDAHVPRLGIPHTEESKAKTSKNRKGKAAGENHYRYGKTVSAEVRAKISAAQKGRPNPRKGKQMSEQGRANVVASIKRGKDSPSFGKRPTNAEDLQRQIIAIQPDGTQVEYASLTYIRDTLGASIATIIRACKSGRPIKFGALSGWVLSNKDAEQNAAPTIPPEYAHLPRSRVQAKEEGAPQYFTGLPCERGHIAPRAAKGTCIMCRREDEKRRRKPIDPNPTPEV